MSPRATKLLYVEGATDREVVFHLCNRHQIDNRGHFDVRASDSYEQVRDALKQETKPGGRLARVGAVVDADEDATDRWRSLIDVLKGNGYTNIEASPAGPAIIPGPSADHPVVGLWVMPDNLGPGMLEDFARQLIPEGDPIWPRACEAALVIQREVLSSERFKDRHLSKAQIHTWLAWKDEPGRPLGQAVGFGMLDVNHALALRFAAWLRRLFIES